MDYQVLFNVVVGLLSVVFGLVCFLGGWILNNMASTLARVDDDMRHTRENYVSKVDYRHELDKLTDTMSGMNKKLDRLVENMGKNGH